MRSIGCLVVLALLPAVTALADEASLSATTSPFNERLTDRVPVSGRSLVGVEVTTTAELPDGAGLLDGRLTLPGSLAGAICVRARTQDGRYEAENTYIPAAVERRSRTLSWSTKYKDQLASVPLRQIAALTTAGVCGTVASVVIPTGVDGAAAADGVFLQVLVNTRGATTWAVLRDPAAGGPALARSHCTRLADGARVAYDARCLFGPLPPDKRFELRLEQEGRDGSSVEVVAKTLLQIGDAQP